MEVHPDMFRKGFGDSERLSAREIPVDPALPRLGALLNPAELERLLRRPLAGMRSSGVADRVHCRIVNIRYRPGLKCQVSYHVRPRQCAGASVVSHFVTATMMNEARAARRLPGIVEAARRHAVRFDYLENYATVLTAFPNDLQIHGLHDALGVDGIAHAMGRASITSRTKAPSTDGGGVKTTVVSYRPERSCLVRCAPAGGRAPWFARTYADDRGARVYAAMRALWEEEGRGTSLSMPEPLAYDARTRTLFHGAVPGQSLRDAPDAQAFMQSLPAIARSLAFVHGCRRPVSESRRSQDELRWLSRMARGLTGVQPASAERLAMLLADLESAAPDPARASRGLLHGDFSLNQVMLHGTQVSVIDFDDVSMGDVCADLGTFLARLRPRMPDQATACRTAHEFQRDYERALGAPVRDDHLRWYQALAFVRLGISALGQLRPGWSARLDAHWRSAETLLAGAVP